MFKGPKRNKGNISMYVVRFYSRTIILKQYILLKQTNTSFSFCVRISQDIL